MKTWPGFADAQPAHRNYSELADELRQSPGEWLVVITASNPNAAWCHGQAIKTGRRAAFRPPGAFEATTRGCDVLARFVGEP